MKSNFSKDIDTEAEVSKFIDQHMYPKLGKSFERVHSLTEQHKGIDVILKTDDNEILIDDKCAFYYANKNLRTFTFELSFLNKQGDIREGWLLNQKLETSHYNLMWLNTKQTDIKPRNIKSEDILDVESMIISKNVLLNYLNKLGYNLENLRLKAKEYRKSNQSRLKLTPHIELIISSNLKEKPINLKIEKVELKKIAEQHLKITESGIENLLIDRVGEQQNDSKAFSPYGAKAEKIVYEAMDKYFKGRDAKVFQHYPVHHLGNQGRYEIDILTVDKISGLSVVEVKGIRIDQITSIQGGDWHMKDYFDISSINPYHQAENQLNALSNHIETDLRLKRKFTKRVVVALPYISKKEWEEKGFHKLTNLPLILFKDDLESGSGISKLEDAYIAKVNKPIADYEWNLLKEYFSIETDEPSNIEAAYSSLYILPSKEAFINKQQEIEDKLYKGIKVTLLCYFLLDSDFWKEKQNQFIEMRQLECFHSYKSTPTKEIITINDGINHEQKLTTDVLNEFQEFNYKQYKIVHVPTDDNQLVTAGAGTGKTHVMVDRIMYLLAKKVNIKDIIMITFTNDSTNEMKRRLQKQLIDLAELTEQVRFSEFAEDVKSMQISTIHSYSKTILKTLAHELGYGTNLIQRSYLHKKHQIINELIDEYYQSHPNTSKIHSLPHFELTKNINQIWNEMERKGFSESEIKNSIDWGTVSKNEEKVIQEVFEYVFTYCEERLNQVKQEENAVSMDDLTRKISELSSDEEKMKQLPHNKYLFMDEFQDSDNVQIQLAASLANYLDYKLFIVGDVKQSIYRFRGADYKSFDLIGKEVVNENHEPDFHKNDLNLNYRSATTVLEKLDGLFSKWQEKEWLPPDEKLIGMYNREEQINEFEFITGKELDKAVIDSIRQSMKIVSNPDFPKGKNRKIALIVRTNNQAKQIEKMCNKAEIPTLQNLDGTFFTSDAVKDFKDLLGGLLFPNKAIHLINALQSPYFRYHIPHELLLQFDGDNEKIIQFINEKIDNDFEQYVKELRTLPIMAIVQKIISEKSFFSHLKTYYRNKYDDNQLEDFLSQYKKNLFHLMNLMQQQFDTMNTTVYNLYNWLTLQMRTNRTENEPMIDKAGESVEITTVHRAKGLQYHTVIIPKTDYGFEAKKQLVHIEELSKEEMDNLAKRKIGWQIEYKKNKVLMENSYYPELDQVNLKEVYKEEARLLYVAMTRVIDRLVVILPNKTTKKTWSELIRAAEIEVSNYGG